MDEFPVLLARDFGIRPQGKAAPMAAAKGAGSFHGTSNLNIGIGPGGDSRSSSFSSSRSKSGWNSNSVGGSFLDGHDGLFDSTATRKTQGYGGGAYDDVLGGAPKHDNNRTETRGGASSSPVFDKPKYDDDSDILDGLLGMKGSSSATVNDDDVFLGVGSPSKQSAALDDLLGDFIRKDSDSESSSGRRPEEVVKESDDLIPGFGGTSPPKNRATSEMNHPRQSTVAPTKSTASMMDDPFVALESTPSSTYPPLDIFNDTLEQMNKPSNSGNEKFGGSTPNGMVSDDMDPLDSLGKSVPMFSAEMNNKGREKIPSVDAAGKESNEKSTVKMSEDTSQMKVPLDNYPESHQPFFDIPSVSSHSNKAAGHAGSRTNFVNADSNETSSWVDMTPKSEENWRDADDVWLTVSEIPLCTQPTSAPPPSQPPPPKPSQVLKGYKGSFAPTSTTKKVNDFPTFPPSTKNFQSPRTVTDSANRSGVSSIDELEDFAVGRCRSIGDEHAHSLSSEEDVETNSAAAAAMKEATDEVKLKHAREVRESEIARAARSREAVQHDAQERELREKQERLDHEREREEKEREQRRIERERESAREIEIEKKARQAVERATREARERAAAEACLKAERAQAEARERAAMEARERAERAAAEARERAAAEAREREAQERAAVARAEAEAQRRNIVDDLSSIFGGTSSSPEEFQETQRDQAERSRIAETLDIEIKRWAAGKEGNLLALLSTLQYVLWPECGWQSVSLADLMTPASVKKVYRKATLCIHPDKVQQKGANLQQKYIAEKVFHLLKEAWTKFNEDPRNQVKPTPS